MARTIGIGCQSYKELIENNAFYIDKTPFIKEWWENFDSVTLITRPRRFGKTLNMSMVEQFFSIDYAGRSDLFMQMNIWREEKYRKLQGTYPVIFMTFADIKETTFSSAKKAVCRNIKKLYNKYDFLLDSDHLNEDEKNMFRKVSPEMEDYIAADSIRALSDYLGRYYGRKPLILLDEYDTPMHEAYAGGYWDELVSFIRSLFNATFKTNPSLEKALMTGITRVSKESVFSDLNNIEVVTTTSEKYSDSFGFTENEVSVMFEKMIDEWFKESTSSYNTFVKALLLWDVEAMNTYMNRVTSATFSYFDTRGNTSEETEPERFYHGFVLGLMTDLEDRYRITSNRESGFGRYDVMLEPLQASDDAVIIEFKVSGPAKKQTLEEAVEETLAQIDRMDYAANLEACGIPRERIRKYGFAFRGKQVLIGEGAKFAAAGQKRVKLWKYVSEMQKWMNMESRNLL